ncbi:unnamed protein product [Toxocara canis]|uniref:Major sperm protein n=1 Tax=Toxocara canis TaxID=6265 RepID=A0A183VA60_TOXCA|nr:unnamed protein product [Toxocara canis]
MPAKLTITPAAMQVSTRGGRTKHRLKCIGDQRVVFKVKLKAKYYKYYKVWPVMGFIQPGTTREITFTRKPGKISKDYLVIQYIIAPSGYDPREPFVKGAQIGQLIFKIDAVEGDPMQLEETTYRGDVVTDAGQAWNKRVTREEDERIEREIAAQYEDMMVDDKDGGAADDDLMAAKTMRAGIRGVDEDLENCKTMKSNVVRARQDERAQPEGFFFRVSCLCFFL